MSDKSIDPRDGSEAHDAAQAPDARRDWVTPTIAELPISASQGIINNHPSADGVFAYS
jgi:hypothetical protein